MISHKIAAHQLDDVCTTAVVRPTNLYISTTYPGHLQKRVEVIY